jgi:hypothetical protein
VAQAQARKLRIYAGEAHDFEGDARLAPFEMPPRNLRRKGQLLVLPDGFVPLNPEAYRKRYGHHLDKMAAAAELAAAETAELQDGGAADADARQGRQQQQQQQQSGAA